MKNGVISLVPGDKRSDSLPSSWTSWWRSMNAPLETRQSRIVWKNGQIVESHNMDLWMGRSGLDPVIAGTILLRDLPPDTGITAHFSATTPHAMRLDITGPDHYSNRTFLMNKGVACPGNFSVGPENRQNGLGRRIMRNQIEFAHAAGMKRINITAALSTGGYAWARFGFLPDMPDLLINGVAAGINQGFTAISRFLTDSEKRDIIPFTRMMRPKDIWHVADNRTDIASRLRDAFESGITHGKGDRLMVADLKYRFREIVAQGKPVTVGQALLCGRVWNGHLDLGNAEQMKRAGDYSGGWKYLTITGGPS